MRWTRPALTTVLCLAAAGCSSGDGRDLAPAEGAAPAVVAAVPLTITEAAGACAVEAAEVARPGTVRLRATNNGAQRHDVHVVAASGAHSAADAAAQIAGDAPVDNWLVPVGGVPTVEPGATGEADVALEVGRYWLLCHPVGATADPARTGVGEVVVDGAPVPLVDPDADAATVTASDGAYTAIGLRSGRHRVRFANSGAQIHHAVLTPIVPGKSFGEARDALVGGADRTSIDVSRAVTIPAVAGGGEAVVSLDLAPGEYLLACLLADDDADPARPRHVDDGMIAHVVVD